MKISELAQLLHDVEPLEGEKILKHFVRSIVRKLTRSVETILPQDLTLPIIDRKRVKNNSLRVLNALREGPCSNRYLAEVGGLRFGGRIHDLRRAGYGITSRNLKHGHWVYELDF